MEFRSYSFKDLLDIIVDNRGKTCPIENDGMPLIATNCIKDNSLYAEYERIRYVSDETYKTWFRGHPEPEDIIFVCKGSPGRVAWVQNPVPYCIAQDMVAIRANKSVIHPKFLFALLRNPKTQKSILNMHVGTMIPHFKKGDFSKLYFDIPQDLAYQKWAGELYFIFCEKIEFNKQINQTLEQMAQAIFKSWFVDFDPVIDNALAAGTKLSDFPEALQQRAEHRKQAQQLIDYKPLPDKIINLFPSEFEQADEPTIGIRGWIPKGWDVKSLSDLLEVKYGKDHKKLNEGMYPVYGSGGLMRNAEKFLYEGESVLIPRKGTLTNLMYVNEAFWTVDTMFYTIPKIEKIAKFAFLHLKTLDFAAMNVGSAVPSMTTKVLNALQVITPPTELLQKFDEIIGVNNQKVVENEANTQQLEKLRDTLLPKLISGELVLADSQLSTEA